MRRSVVKVTIQTKKGSIEFSTLMKINNPVEGRTFYIGKQYSGKITPNLFSEIEKVELWAQKRDIREGEPLTIIKLKTIFLEEDFPEADLEHICDELKEIGWETTDVIEN